MCPSSALWRTTATSAARSGKCHQIFGKSHLDETAQAYHLPVLARLPIDPAVAEACDAGRVESLDTTELEPALQAILAR